MFDRINPFVAAGEDGDRAGRKAATMRRGVDAARQTGHDGKSGVAEIARDLRGKLRAGRGGISRADHRDQRARQGAEVAAQSEQRRRVADHLQARRVIGLAGRDENDTACR